MQLPDADQAIIEPCKVRDYLLSPTHAVGRYKAVFFEALGFRQADWQLLASELLRLAKEGVGSIGPCTDYGQKYECVVA